MSLTQDCFPPLSPDLQRKPTSCRRGAPHHSPGPLVQAEDKTAPHPHTSSASFKSRGQACGGPAPLPELSGGRTTPLYARRCRAGERAESGARGLYPPQPHPEPLLYPDRASSSGPSPVPAPSSAAAAAASRPQAPLGSRSTLSGSLSRFQRGCSLASLPAPSFLPST